MRPARPWPMPASTWHDVQFAFGGSDSAGNADTLVSDLGLTGLPFINVANGCATGGSALTMADSTIRSGAFDLGMAIGFDKHPRGAFDADPEGMGDRQVVRRDRSHAHDAVLRHEDPALHARSRHHQLHADQGGREGLSQRIDQPQCVAANAAVGGGHRRLGHDLRTRSPSTCSARPVREASPSCCVGPIDARRYTDRPVYLKAATLRSRRFGSFEVFSPGWRLTRADSPTVEASQAAYEQAGIGPHEIDVAQIQDTESGAEIMHMAENGLCKHGEQEALVRSGATEIGGIAADQHRRRMSGQWRADRRVGTPPGVRKRPATSWGRRRPPGRRQSESRIHPRLRSARDQRLHGAHPLTSV